MAYAIVRVCLSFGSLLKNKSKENSLTELIKNGTEWIHLALWKYEMPFGQRKCKMEGKMRSLVLFVLCYVIYYVCLLKLEQYA